jgi:hypothetical protein
MIKKYFLHILVYSYIIDLRGNKSRYHTTCLLMEYLYVLDSIFTKNNNFKQYILVYNTSRNINFQKHSYNNQFI